MKSLVAVAAVVLGVAFPVCAQRTSSHGGSSAHAAPSFHGSFSAPAARGFATAPRNFGGRPAYVTHSYRPNAGNAFAHRAPYNPSSGSHPSGGDPGRGRRRGPYVINLGYGVGPVIGWYGPGYLSYGDGFDDDSQDASQGYADNGSEGYDQSAGPTEPNGSNGVDGYYGPEEPNGYGPLAPWPGPSAPRMPYRPPPAGGQAALAFQGEGAVTLIFKDGRPPEQIHNYVLTPTTIYVGDQHSRDIALDQIDIAATEKFNREAGVDFLLPSAVN
jgi:hypothetical protein